MLLAQPPPEGAEAGIFGPDIFAGEVFEVQGFDDYDYSNFEDLDDYEDEDEREYRMTDKEIALFEMEYGVEYDPYYDDPYKEEELPDDVSFNVDKKYGDRIYENGEIFYKDRESGLFYRQGAKPRNLSFWG